MMGGRLSSGRVTILDEKSFYIPNLMLRAVDPGEKKKSLLLKERCLSVCLFVRNWRPNHWMDPNKI